MCLRRKINNLYEATTTMKKLLFLLSLLISLLINAEDYSDKKLQELLKEIKANEHYSAPQNTAPKVESLDCSELDKKIIKLITDKAEIVTLGTVTTIKTKEKRTKQDPFTKEHTIYFEPLLTWKGNPEAPFLINISTGVASFDFTVEKGESYLLFLEKNNKYLKKDMYRSVCKAPFDSLSNEKRIDVLNEILNNKT